MGLGGQRLGARGQFRIVGQERGVVLADHRRAGARRHDQIVVWLEGCDHLGGEGPGIVLVAGIVGRLAATALGARHLDRAARRLQQLDRGEADAGPEHIDQTGHEQPNAGRGFGHGGWAFLNLSRIPG